eukprot:TRINITY_DN61_c0_g1_i14.p1 TRINITY_DN61_c0_g1~~TRINITY_DN61_c0_g1_i14.p1  ORF type:complete len:107 (-),score=11.95 TRINITY_DN61_c0_g1_i14:162-482(-)
MDPGRHVHDWLHSTPESQRAAPGGRGRGDSARDARTGCHSPIARLTWSFTQVTLPVWHLALALLLTLQFLVATDKGVPAGEVDVVGDNDEVAGVVVAGVDVARGQS